VSRRIVNEARGAGPVACSDCDQRCCRSVCIEVDPPRSHRDYSDLLFYLYHRDTRIVVAKNARHREWYVEFVSPCRHLVDGRCRIYQKRPPVCREHEMESCERNRPENFLYIESPREFFDFLENDGRTRALEYLRRTHAAPGPAAKSARRAKVEPQRRR